MSFRENLDRVHERINDDPQLLGAIQSVVAGHRSLVAAHAEIAEAEESVRAATAWLEAVHEMKSDREEAMYAAEIVVENRSTYLGARIAGDEALDDISRTLFPLVLNKSRMDGNVDSQGYLDYKFRGAAFAMDRFMDRLQPGEPLMRLGLGEVVQAAVIPEDPLKAVLPKYAALLSSGLRGGGITNDASISLTTPGAVKAKSIFDGLVKVEDGDESVTLLSKRYEINLKRFYSLIGAEDSPETGTDDVLVIGEAAIAEKMATLDGREGFVAATAMQAAGIEVEYEVDAEVRYLAVTQLIELLAHLAGGGAEERVPLREPYRHPQYIDDARGRTEPSPASKMARTIDSTSFRFMSAALGVDGAYLEERATALLKERSQQPGLNLALTVKTRESLRSLHDTVVQIFDTES